MLSTVAEFDFNSATSIPARFRAIELLDVNVDLDYSILRLEQKAGAGPGATHGSLKLDPQATVTVGDALIVVQHPAGEPKMASIADCEASGLNKVGTGGTPPTSVIIVTRWAAAPGHQLWAQARGALWDSITSAFLPEWKIPKTKEFM